MVINRNTRPNKGKEELIRKASSNVVGVAGLGEDWSTRRRIMQALRKSTSVLGIGQKCRIGRLGGGAAIGAAIGGVVMGFATPAIAQYAVGGGTAAGAGSVAIGTGSTATNISGVAIGNSNAATSNDTVQQQILDRVTGALLNYPTGQTLITSSAVAIGDDNTVSNGAGVAIGDSNQVTGAVAGIAIGNGNVSSGGFATAIGIGNLTSGGSSTAIGVGNVASNNTAIAMGRQNTASGQTSIAMGNVSTANQTNAIAIGHSTQATGIGAIAMGGGNNSASTNLDATAARAAAANAIAIGTNTTALLANAVALGNSSDATGVSSVAIGNGSTASGTQSIAIGTGNLVSGNNSGAVGDPNTVTGSGSYAFGNNNTVNADNAFAIGNNITIAAGRNGSVGIGDATTVAAPNSGAFTLNGGTAAATAPTAVVSVGSVGGERQITNVAAGVVSGTSTNAVNGSQLFTVANAANNLGNSLESVTGGGLVINADGTIATAPSISAAGATYNTVTGAVQALNTANTTTNTGIANALGGGAAVAANGTVTAPSYLIGGTTYNDVGSALGALSSSTLVQQTGGPGAGQITIGAATGGTSLSVAGTSGSRTLTGVQNGALTPLSTDAVNGAQVNVLAASIATNAGGGSTFNAATGTVTAPTITVGGTAYSNLTSAIEAAGAGHNLTTAATGTGIANGTSVASIGAGETQTLTAGNNIITTQVGNEVQVALNPALTGITSLAITGGPALSASGINMNGTGISSLLAGSTAAGSTDAVNGGQINTGLASVATTLGGGSTYNPVTGTVTAPSYTVQGSSYTNVGDAFGGVNSAIDGLENGTSGLVQQAGGAPGTGQISVGTTTGGTLVSFAGTGGERVLTGVAAGALNATSADAVNGAQVNALSTSTANSIGGGASFDPVTGLMTAPAITVGGTSFANVTDAVEAGDLKADELGASTASGLGGGSTYDPTTGTVSAPSYSVAGSTQNNVGAALSALNAANISANTGLANAIGGGASVLADGTVSAPVVAVNGTNYNNLTDAISAAGAGHNLTTAATGTGIANGTSVASIGAGETQTLTAGNNIITTQVGNEVQVALNPALTGITSLAITGGPTISATGITGLAAGALSASSTDAVNGSQLFATNEAITNLSNGTSGLVQQAGGAPGAGQISVGAATGGSSASIAGTDGDRVLTGVAAGALTATSADAVNGAQIFANNQSVAGLLGGGAGVDPVTGALTAPSYGVGGNAYGNVGAALSALQSGAPVQFSTAGAPTTPNGLVPSQNMTLVGAAAGPVTLSNVGPASLTPASTEAVNGSQINALAASNAAIIGGGSTFDPITGVLTAPTISVGGSNYASISDAIEAGDDKADAGLQNVADALGGGAVYDPATGSISAPSYAVQGSNFTNAGAAFGAVNSALNNLTNGASGLVQQAGGAPGSGNLTIGATTGGTVVDFTGTDGVRSVTGLANGILVAGSTDAVTGGQVNAGLTSVADALGGGASFDPVTGTVIAPAYSVAGGSQSDAGAAFAALNTASNAANAGISSVIGGGMAIGLDGTLTSPSFNVNGSSYGTVADALAAAGGGFNLTTAATGSGIANGSSVEQIGAGETVTLTAGNNIITTQVGGETQVALNAALSGITSLSITGGPTLSNTGIAMNGGGISGLAAGSTAAGSTDAVNGGQLFTTNTNVANLGARVGTVEGDVTAIQSDVASLANGTSGLVQQAVGTAPITVGAATGGTMLNVAGTAGNRTVTGVAAGAVTASSTDAVNGAQLFAVQTTAEGALQRSGGAMTGNIDMGGNRITNLAAPLAGTDAVNRDYVDGLAAAGSATTNALGTTTAANLGGGATFDPATGTISAPSYVVGGVARTNVGDAIAATNRLGVQYVPDAAGNPTNAVALTGDGSGQAVAVTNVAAGALTATSSDAVNGSQLYAVQQVTAGAVQYDRNADGSLNTSSVTFGPPNTPTVLRNVAAATRSTDAVNLGQFNAGLAATLGSANAYTDTKINQISFDLGKVAKRAYAGTASAIALQPPAILDAGSVAMRGGVGYYRGAWAMGLSLRATADNGRWSLSGGVAGGPNSGVAASAGIDLVLGD